MRTVTLGASTLLLVVLAIGTSGAFASAHNTWSTPVTGTFTATASGVAMPVSLWHHATPSGNLTVQLSISGSWKGYVNASRNFAAVGLNVTSGSLTVNGTTYQIVKGTGEYLNSSRTGGYLRGQHNNATFSYLTLQLYFTNSTTTTTSHNLPRHMYTVNVMLSGSVSNGNVNLKGELMFANPVTKHKVTTRPNNYRLLLQGTATGLP
jgi:hypothetical protein